MNKSFSCKHILSGRLVQSLVLLIAFSIIPASIAQDEFVGVTLELTEVRAGPGVTFEIVGALPGGVEADIIERNEIGNWLHIEGETPDGEVDGWLMTGALILPDDFLLSEVEVNEEIADADPETVPDERLAALFAVPILPEIDPNLEYIVMQGETYGFQPDVVTKVGDSNSAALTYLPPIDEAEYDPGIYDFLQPTIDFFGESFKQGSIAAKVGLNAFSVFDPIWADPDDCEPNEIPLTCEYRNSRAAIALIMFGANDLRALNSDDYREQMTRIVEQTLDYGVIPVLSTFSVPPNDPMIDQVLRFNQITVEIAEEYSVPLINLWAAARALPRYGIGDDNVHLTSPGVGVRFEGQESIYGGALQNLLVLHTLDRIRVTLGLDESQGS